MESTLIVVTGPTAVGKTKLAIELAQHFNTEIISADSRQFYKEMSIGTAKPTADELAQVPHHFVNNCSIQEEYSAGDFEREALDFSKQFFGSNRNILIAVGGSGLYVKALCEGLDDMPPVDYELRNHLIASYEKEGINWLQKEMERLDPIKFQSVDQRNPQRLMRMIEIHHQAPFIKKEKLPRPFRVIKIGVDLPREILYNRINKRVDQMMELGLEAEVKSLLPFKDLNALQTVGYSEFFDYFDGQINLDRAVELVKQHSRNYAKRQLTWFRADADIKWFSPDKQSDVLNFLPKF
ncbi:MAG: tRNA (adenosine(37)-N6)-dimethylallyltransferase MiaA [Bacteroidia bacterium]|nr:tRNA (adenosine(37)-N6)-dimethylallyltransferase MiaA [Bacteroidia bacterium]MCF8425280.1 tRNA (adenosine(37)-N6)-dimethylallyltransferase MiaA [Bacteroidia bacterium]MCF8446586.1 tRNA (adenosine(37)-N6)-dimethylallyltransferase MiaA [Bacteroidia bacterium]